MGQQVLLVIDEATDCQVAGVWLRTTESELAGLLAGADVAIDFTLPQVTREIAGIAAEQRVPLVCGVTGLGVEAEHAIAAATQHIALLYECNMSTGIAVVTTRLRQAAAALGAGYQAEIREDPPYRQKRRAFRTCNRAVRHWVMIRLTSSHAVKGQLSANTGSDSRLPANRSKSGTAPAIAAYSRKERSPPHAGCRTSPADCTG